ncbi:MAG: hypothetical protein IPK58_19160 [Acidobacteria bacterium]|nr:hypothetical protein [Acidobacteriota bacterium]
MRGIRNETNKIGYLLLLISGVLAGCDSVQTIGQTENLHKIRLLQNIIQKDNKTPDKVLFKGDNITVIEKNRRFQATSFLIAERSLALARQMKI